MSDTAVRMISTVLCLWCFPRLKVSHYLQVCKAETTILSPLSVLIKEQFWVHNIWGVCKYDTVYGTPSLESCGDINQRLYSVTKTRSSLLKKPPYFYNAERSVTVTMLTSVPGQLKTDGHYTDRTANKKEKKFCLHADPTRESSIFRYDVD